MASILSLNMAERRAKYLEILRIAWMTNSYHMSRHSRGITRGDRAELGVLR